MLDAEVISIVEPTTPAALDIVVRIAFPQLASFEVFFRFGEILFVFEKIQVKSESQTVQRICDSLGLVGVHLRNFFGSVCFAESHLVSQLVETVEKLRDGLSERYLFLEEGHSLVGGMRGRTEFYRSRSRRAPSAYPQSPPVISQAYLGGTGWSSGDLRNSHCTLVIFAGFTWTWYMLHSPFAGKARMEWQQQVAWRK